MSTVTAEHIKGLTWDFLAVNYDNPRPIPPFHMEMWDLCCSDNPKVAIAAPRLHAKSTSITHTYTLMMLLSRVKRFCLIVSSTESLAIEFLGDIKAELEENEPLRQKFGVKKFLKEKETNVVCLLLLVYPLSFKPVWLARSIAFGFYCFNPCLKPFRTFTASACQLMRHKFCHGMRNSI